MTCGINKPPTLSTDSDKKNTSYILFKKTGHTEKINAATREKT